MRSRGVNDSGVGQGDPGVGREIQGWVRGIQVRILSTTSGLDPRCRSFVLLPFSRKNVVAVEIFLKLAGGGWSFFPSTCRI